MGLILVYLNLGLLFILRKKIKKNRNNKVFIRIWGFYTAILPGGQVTCLKLFSAFCCQSVASLSQYHTSEVNTPSTIELPWKVSVWVFIQIYMHVFKYTWLNLLNLYTVNSWQTVWECNPFKRLLQSICKCEYWLNIIFKGH